MLEAVPFGSCYVYSPQGTGAVSVRSRLLCARLKDRDPRFMDRYAWRVRQDLAQAPLFDGWFDSATVLVPVPGSQPQVPGGASTAEMLASALLARGIGACVWTGLRRVVAVRKSATAGGRRPSVYSHYDSFSVESVADAPAKLLLVDDVVTKGRTLMAAASRLQESYPYARIDAFALLRTMGLVAEITRLIEPCLGEIRWRRGDAHRFP
jgi:hypothetical protein